MQTERLRPLLIKRTLLAYLVAVVAMLLLSQPGLNQGYRMQTPAPMHVVFSALATVALPLPFVFLALIFPKGRKVAKVLSVMRAIYYLFILFVVFGYGSLVFHKETVGTDSIYLRPLLPADFASVSPEAQSDMKRFTALFACEALTQKLDGDSEAAEIEAQIIYEISRESTDNLYTDRLETKVKVNALLSQGYDPREFQSAVCGYGFGKGWQALLP